MSKGNIAYIRLLLTMHVRVSGENVLEECLEWCQWEGILLRAPVRGSKAVKFRAFIAGPVRAASHGRWRLSRAYLDSLGWKEAQIRVL